MGKKPKKEWPHSPDELLALAVQKCNELGRMPSRRAWSHDGFFDFEELVMVLGKGSWERAEGIIRLAWGQATQQKTRKGETVMVETKQVEVAMEGTAAEETVMVEAEEVIEAEVAAETPAMEVAAEEETKPETETQVETRGKGHKGRRYTHEELIEAWRSVCEKLGTDRPTQTQVNQLARETGTPSYGTFLRLGPRKVWSEHLKNDAAKTEAAEETKEETPLVSEMVVKDVLVRSLEMEVEIEGRPMRLRLKFEK